MIEKSVPGLRYVHNAMLQSLTESLPTTVEVITTAKEEYILNGMFSKHIQYGCDGLVSTNLSPDFGSVYTVH